MNILPRTVNSFTSAPSSQLVSRSLSDPNYEHLDIPEDDEEDGFFEDVGTGIASGLEGFGKSLVGLADMALGDMFDMDDDFYEKRAFGRPTGIVGGLAEGITQFAAGLIPGGFAVSLLSKAGRAATAIRFSGATTKTLKGITAGSVADFVAFDGQEARLSDLLAEHTDLLAPVTDYLKSNEDDTQFEGRMKNVIEGGAIGGAVGGLVWTGAKLVKAMKNFDGSEKSIQKLTEAKEAHNQKLVESGEETAKGQAMLEEVLEEADKIDPNDAFLGTRKTTTTTSTDAPSGTTTELPEDFENVSGKAALDASSRLTDAILGSTYSAERAAIFKKFTPGLIAEDVASPAKRAAEIRQGFINAGMDVGPLDRGIRSGVLDNMSDPIQAQAMKEARAGQQISFIGMQTSAERIAVLGTQRVKELAKAIPDQNLLDDITMKVAAQQRNLEYYTATQAAFGTQFSKGLLDRQSKFVSYFQEKLGLKPSDQTEQGKYDVTMAKILIEEDDLTDALGAVNIKETDKISKELLEDADTMLTPDNGKATKDKQKKLSKTLLTNKERLVARKTSLENQLKAKQKESIELSAKDPDAVKKTEKAPKNDVDDPDHALRSEIRDLEAKIQYHDSALKGDRDIITLREEEHYITTLSPDDYTARVKALEASKKRRAKANEKAPTTVDELRKIIKSKGDHAQKLAAAQKQLTNLRKALFEPVSRKKPKLQPSAGSTKDPEMAEILEKIESAEKMIKENGNIESVLEEIQSLTKLTDQQFAELQNAQTARQKLMDMTPESRLKNLRKTRKEYIALRTEAINKSGTAFTTKKGVDAWLQARPGREKGFDTFMKQMMYAVEGESPLDAFAKINEMSQMTGFDKFVNLGTRLFQRNLLSGLPTTTLNVGMPLAVRLLTKLERIVGSGMGALSGDKHQRQVFFEALKFHQQVGDFKMVFKAASKGVSTKTDVVTGGRTPFTDATKRSNIDALDPKLYGVNEDTATGKAMGWMNTWFNLPFAMNAGGDSMNKAAAGISNLRERAMNHVHTHADWVNKPLEAKEAWVDNTVNKAFLEDGAMYSESSIHSAIAKQARENILSGDKAGQVVDNPMLIPNEVRRLTLEKKDMFLRDQEAVKLIEDTKQYTREVTFTDPNQGEFVGLVNRAREKFPPLVLILPCVNTPAQILSFGLKRTPMGYAYDKIAPLLSRKARDQRTAMAKMSPMQKAEYQGRMATATAGSAALVYYSYLNRDKITGSGPRNPDELKALRATGWQPNSFVVGPEDKPTYISYQRLDPLATIIGISADIAEHMAMSPKLEAGSEESFMSLAFSITENITDKSFLRGLNNVLNAMQQPEVYGPKIFRDVASGMAVPMSIKNMKDIGESEVLIRESRSVVDAILRKLPIVSEKIPPKRDFLGAAIYKQNPVGLLGILNPIYISSKKQDSVDKTIQELVYGFGMPSTNYIGNRETDMREFYNAEGRQAYDRFLELTDTITINGRTLRESLKGLVNSRKFKAFGAAVKDAGGQAQLIDRDPRITEMNKVISAYRRKSKRAMSLEFPELVQTVKDIYTKKKQLSKSAAQEFNNPIPTQ